MDKNELSYFFFFSNNNVLLYIYFWYLTAPRRFVILLMRVFVRRSNAVLLLPKSDILLRYFINDELSLLHELAAPLSPLNSPFDRWPLLLAPLLLAPPPSRMYDGKGYEWRVLLLLLLLPLLLLSMGFHGKDDLLLFVEFVLFEKCVDESFEGFCLRFWAFCLLVFNWFHVESINKIRNQY